MGNRSDINFVGVTKCQESHYYEYTDDYDFVWNVS